MKPFIKCFDDETLVNTLKELLEAAQRGELVKASFRLYQKDGTYEDVALGAESEEERLAMLSELRASITTKSN